MSNFPKEVIDYDRDFSKAKVGLMAETGSVFVCTILFSLKHSWNTAIPTAQTDGESLEINPDWFHAMKSKERIGLLAHEAWHVAFDHISRATNFDKRKYNIAADHVINLMLLENDFKLPEGGLADPQYRNMSTEEVYKLLPEPPFEPIPGCGDDLKEITGTPEEVHNKQNAVKDLIIKASTQARMAGDDPGKLPGDIRRAIEEMANPKLPWFQILMNHMREFDKTDYSYRKINRRYLPEFMLPGLHGESMGELALAFDASGSVSKEEFSAYFGETKHMRDVMKPTKTTIIEFDTRISSVWELNEMDSMDDIHFTGGGGTNLTPVFDYFAGKNKKHPNGKPPTVLVIFSDLCCSKITEDPGYPVIWVCVNNKNGSVNFGELIHYTTEK